MGKPQYDVWTWDHEGECWERAASCHGHWELRPVIRRLLSDGWSDVSVLIERRFEGG